MFACAAARCRRPVAPTCHHPPQVVPFSDTFVRQRVRLGHALLDVARTLMQVQPLFKRFSPPVYPFPQTLVARAFPALPRNPSRPSTSIRAVVASPPSRRPPREPQEGEEALGAVCCRSRASYRPVELAGVCSVAPFRLTGPGAISVAPAPSALP
jgi:hypothetical protein